MRLLLDECVPKRLKRELLGHEVKTVQDMGWAGIKNGALLKLADGQFDALLTDDVDDLRPLLPGVEQALASLRTGEVMRVGA